MPGAGCIIVLLTFTDLSSSPRVSCTHGRGKVGCQWRRRRRRQLRQWDLVHSRLPGGRQRTRITALVVPPIPDCACEGGVGVPADWFGLAAAARSPPSSALITAGPGRLGVHLGPGPLHSPGWRSPLPAAWLLSLLPGLCDRRNNCLSAGESCQGADVSRPPLGLSAMACLCFNACNTNCHHWTASHRNHTPATQLAASLISENCLGWVLMPPPRTHPAAAFAELLAAVARGLDDFLAAVAMHALCMCMVQPYIVLLFSLGSITSSAV